MPITRQVNEESITHTYTHTGMLSKPKREGNSAICYNTGEIKRHFLNEISRHKKRNTASLTCMRNL